MILDSEAPEDHVQLAHAVLQRGTGPSVQSRGELPIELEALSATLGTRQHILQMTSQEVGQRNH